ncbi:MAG: phage holin family protein [Clostridiales bacterium]|nr:phage holin family protein [Clostridiales bacterium]
MVFQTAPVCYYIANEGISVVENAGLMGLPVLDVVTRADEREVGKDRRVVTTSGVFSYQLPGIPSPSCGW